MSEHAGRSEPSAIPKDFKNRMIKFDIGNRQALAGFGLHGLAKSCGQNVRQRLIETIRIRMWSRRNDQLSAILNKLLQAGCQRRRQRTRVVKNYQSIFSDPGRIGGAGGLYGEGERQRVV